MRACRPAVFPSAKFGFCASVEKFSRRMERRYRFKVADRSSAFLENDDGRPVRGAGSRSEALPVPGETRCCREGEKVLGARPLRSHKRRIALGDDQVECYWSRRRVRWRRPLHRLCPLNEAFDRSVVRRKARRSPIPPVSQLRCLFITSLWASKTYFPDYSFTVNHLS